MNLLYGHSQAHNKQFNVTRNSWPCSFFAILANNFLPIIRALALMEKRTMTLETTGIDYVNLHVNNLQESFRFWERLLGFVILEEIPSQQGMIIGNKAAKLALYENAELGRVNKHGVVILHNKTILSHAITAASILST